MSKIRDSIESEGKVYVKRAVLIGINYQGTKSMLRGCINDVTSIKQLLITQYGYEENNILVLTDNMSSVFSPTKANIYRSFSWLISSNINTDFTNSSYKNLEDKNYHFTFHYSGHGSQIRDTSGDEVDGMDEVICPVDYEKQGFITDDELRTKLALKVPTGSVLTAVLDCCNSGSGFDLLWNVIPTQNGFNLTKMGKYSDTPGKVIMLSGCKDEQTSADAYINGVSQGALTNSLLNILKRNNYRIEYDELIKNIRQYIISNNLSDQIPCLSFGNQIDINGNFTF